MSLVDYFRELTEKIEEELSLDKPINLGRLTTNRESIALRIMPGGSESYYAGKRSRNINFQVLVKSEKQTEAINTIEKIVDKLIENDCDMYSEPSYLQSDEQGYIYTTALTAHI